MVFFRQWKTNVVFVVIGILLTTILSIQTAVAAAKTDPSRKYYNLAKSYVQKRNYKMAEAVLSKGLMQFPRSIKLLDFRGLVRGDYLKKPNGAIADYTRIIKLSGSHRAYMKRGQFFYRLKQYHAAIKDLSCAIKISPRYGKAYMLRAEVYGRIGMIQQAITDLKKCVRYSPKYKPEAQKIMKKLGNPSLQ